MGVPDFDLRTGRCPLLTKEDMADCSIELL